MTVTPATLVQPEARDGSAPFVPSGWFRGDPADFDYVEEEWFASGEVEGHPYVTTVYVRRPRDPNRFSGTVMVEPVHAMSAAPVWQYVSSYLMRAGHGFAAIGSQKSTLETHVKPFDPERYASLDIWSDAPPPDDAAMTAPPRDPAAMQARMEAMRKLNVLSTPILAQVGAAISDGAGPFEGYDVRHVILAGHSQTGGVVTEYILNGHDTCRRDDGSPVYDGYFPSGTPGVTFGGYDVPIVQVVSDGDISDPHRAGRENRTYRRADSDEPDDRYRLYELAGVPHMGTRRAPYNDSAMWRSGGASMTAGDVPEDAVMNSLPHNELFSMAMHHLIQWVADGVTPPARRPHRGRARRPLRQGRGREQPRRRALRADGRPAPAVLLESRDRRGRGTGTRRGRHREAHPEGHAGIPVPRPRRLRGALHPAGRRARRRALAAPRGRRRDAHGGREGRRALSGAAPHHVRQPVRADRRFALEDLGRVAHEDVERAVRSEPQQQHREPSADTADDGTACEPPRPHSSPSTLCTY